MWCRWNVNSEQRKLAVKQCALSEIDLFTCDVAMTLMGQFCFCCSVRLGTIIVAFVSMVSMYSFKHYRSICIWFESDPKRGNTLFLFNCIWCGSSQIQAMIPLALITIVGADDIREYVFYFEQNYEYPKEGHIAVLVKYMKTGRLRTELLFGCFASFQWFYQFVSFFIICSDVEVFMGASITFLSVYCATCLLAVIGAYKVIVWRMNINQPDIYHMTIIQFSAAIEMPNTALHHMRGPPYCSALRTPLLCNDFA